MFVYISVQIRVSALEVGAPVYFCPHTVSALNSLRLFLGDGPGSPLQLSRRRHLGCVVHHRNVRGFDLRQKVGREASKCIDDEKWTTIKPCVSSCHRLDIYLGSIAYSLSRRVKQEYFAIDPPDEDSFRSFFEYRGSGF